jgi:hypothetical protein
MKRLFCLITGHHWRPYWTPGQTWRGRRCSLCKKDEHGFDLMLEAYDALPPSDPLRVSMDAAREAAR